MFLTWSVEVKKGSHECALGLGVKESVSWKMPGLSEAWKPVEEQARQ